MSASRPGHVELQRTLDSIVVGHRHRTDLGDMNALKSSIERDGLLQPITVTPEGVLVCGRRRLEALRQLGVRSANVWVRSGITGRLGELLAEQDDNLLHKPLSLLEAESLYRELKVVLAEDAAQRQAGSRFGSAARAQGAPADPDGSVESTAPRAHGEARVQAARLVTGRGSQTMLEQIGRLKDLANDGTRSEDIRTQAAEELTRIEAGQKVTPSRQRMDAALALEELETVSADDGESDEARTEAARAVRQLRVTAAAMGNAAGLARRAKAAVARVSATKSSQQESSPAPATRVNLPPRAFVAVWNDLDGWTRKYDPVEIAEALSEAEWELVERSLAETAEFVARIDEARTGLSGPADTAAGGPTS